MNTLNNLNPDFYKTIVKQPGQRDRMVIYTTLESFSITSKSLLVEDAYPVDPKLDLYIYADTLHIYDSISMPLGNIKIVAKKIVLENDITFNITPDQKPVVPSITTNARPFAAGGQAPRVPEISDSLWLKYPPNPTNKNYLQYREIQGTAPTNKYKGGNGKDGEKGLDAGIIHICCEQLVTTNAKDKNKDFKFNLIANGGKGQLGQGGMNAPASQPGLAGQAWIPIGRRIWDKKGHIVLTTLWNGVYQRFATRGGDGGIGGDAGRGGDGGKSGLVTVIAPKEQLKSISIENKGGQPGEDGEPGLQTGPSAGGELKVMYVTDDPTKPTARITMRPGGLGKNGSKVKRQASEGVGGVLPSKLIEFSAESFAGEFDSTFLMKVLQKAKMLFQFEPPYLLPNENERKKSKTYELLSWLLDTIDVKDKSAESLRKEEIQKEAIVLLNYYSKTKNIYGHSQNWVPRLGLSTYISNLEQVSSLLTDVEANYKETFKIDAENADKKVDLNLLLRQLNTKKIILEAKIDELKKGIPIVTNTLYKCSEALSSNKGNMHATLSKYETEIAKYVDCNFGNILKAAEMIAFDPENLAMAAVQGANLLNKSLNEIDGVKKEYLFNDIDKIEGMLDDQGKQVDLIDGLRSKVNDPDSQAKLIIVSLDDFEKKMEKINGHLKDDGVNLKTTIAQLKSLIQIRGQARIEYKTRYSMILQYTTQIRTIDSKIDNINNKLDRSFDPTETGTISYLAVLYQNTRDIALKSLFSADQALKFTKVSNTGSLQGYELFRKKSLWVDGEFPSQFTALELKTECENIKSEMIKSLEGWGTTAQQIPSKDDTIGEMKVVVDDPDFIEFIKVNDNYNFDIITKNDNALNDNEFTVNGTNGKFNIRVNYVRPRLIFKNTNKNHGVDNVEITIQHHGNSSILDDDSSLYKFNHQSIIKSFVQDITKTPDGKDFGKGSDGSFLTKGPNGKYPIGKDSLFAPVGLFAKWSFSIDVTDENSINKGIDLTDLKSIEIEFGCSFFQ